jgi:hypothetical protein
MSNYWKSLKAKLTMPNRKAKLQEYKRIHNPYIHNRIVQSLLNDI